MKRTIFLFCAVMICALLLPVAAGAQTIPVATEAELRTAIATASPGSTIVFSNNITLTGDLPSIASNITVDGGGHTLSGDNQFRGLMVASITGGSTSPVTVSIKDITIADTVAKGGNGGSGSAGGGGGAGLGGGLFVAAQAAVTLENVNFNNNRAIGGNGGAVSGSGAAGGGGGMGGNGGDGVAGIAGGGGGGVGVGANGGSNSAGGAGIMTGGGAGGDSLITPGGVTGGGGASSVEGAAGGGESGQSTIQGFSTPGGYGGGGGGGQSGFSGSFGGFGGGGGGGTSSSGSGGTYGGGGGDEVNTPTVPGGLGAGRGGGSAAPGGGGGAGIGGGIFIDAGGSITVNGGVTVNGSSVSGGAGSGEGTSGNAYGAGMFFGSGGNTNVTFNAGVGETTTIGSTIIDQTGAFGPCDCGSVLVNKTGAGTLVLTGIQGFKRGVDINGGTVQVSSVDALGTGNIGIFNTGTLAVTGTTTIGQAIRVDGATAINASSGQTVTITGQVQDQFSGSGSIAFGGGGTIGLTNGANSYSGGTSIAGNTTVAIGADGALGLAGTSVALGDGVTAGTLSYGTGTSLGTNRAITVNTGGGTIDTAGSADVTLTGVLSGSGTFTKSGTGTLTIAGSNGLAGTTVVGDGTLRAGISGALGNGAVQVGSTATLDLNNYDQFLGSLAGAGQVTLGAATLSVGFDNTNTTYAGAISGTGGLFKGGTGTLTLTGLNSYGGGTTVSSGTLSGTTDGIQGNIANSGVVEFNQGVSGTYAGSMSGLGSLVKSGTGTVTLTGINNYGGGTNVNGGVLAGTTDSLQGNIANNAVVQFNQAGNGFYSGTMTGTGTLVKSGTGTVTLTGLNSYSGGTLISGGTLAGDTTTIQGTIQNDANLLFDQNTNGTYAGTLFGTGSLTKTGSGTLTLTGTSAYTGGTTISDGLLVGNTQNIQGNIANNASLLFAQGIDGVFTGNISGTGNLSKSGAGILVLNGTNSYSGGTSVQSGGLLGTTLSLQGNISNSGQVIFSQNGNGSYTGTMFGTGSLVKEGTGVVTLTGTNFYTGGTIVNGGALSGNTTSLQGGITNNAVVEFNQAANGTYAGIMTGTGTLVKSGTGTVTLTGVNTYSGGTLIAGGTLAGDTTTIQGTIQNDANLLFNQNTSGTYAGTLFGTGSMTKTGTGTLTLTGISAYTGGTTISGGTLIGNTQNLQGNIANNANLLFNQATDGLFTGNITGNGNLTKSGAGILVLNGTNSYTGGTSVQAGGLLGTTLSLQGGISNSGQVIFSQNGNGSYTGTMFGTGSLVKEGTGVVTLTGANTYTGGTTVTGGALSGNTTSLQGGIVNDAVVEFNQASNGAYTGVMSGTGTLVKSGAGTLTVTGINTYSGGTLVSGGSLAGDSTGIQGNIQNDANVTFNQGAAGTYNGIMVGTGSVTKNGTGVLTLTGQSAYTGGTTINAGTLAGSTQNIQGNVQNNAALVFDQLFDGIFTGSISGNGSLTKSGTGVVVLNGTSSYTGGTTILAGGLMGTTSNLLGNISDSGQVIFNQDFNGLFSGNIFGTGSLVKSGAGILTLSSPQAYTGGTFITGGAIEGDSTTLLGSIGTSGTGRIIFNQAVDGVYAGNFGGTGGFTKNGAGTLTLTGQGAITGGVTIAAGGLAGSTQNIQGPVVNNGALTLNQSFSGLFSGNISGTGSFLKAGSGTVILDGTNSYTGGTTITGGALVGTSSSLQGSILNNAQVIFNQNTNGVYAGSMSGNGSLTKTGTGTLTLSGTNNYSGGTFISGGGGVSIATDASLGAAGGSIGLGDAASNGSLLFTNTNLFASLRNVSLGAGGGVFDTAGAQVTLFGSLTGAGGLTKNGIGVLELAGGGSYAGSTIVNAGTLRAGTSGAFGSGALFLAGGTALDLNGFNQAVGSITGSGNVLLGSGTLTTGSDGASGLFTGVISGSGSLVKTGGGTLALTGANTYSGGTSVLGGALLGNTTTIQGNILNNGLVLFDQNNNGTYAGSMSGSGALAKSGSGVLTLTGNNSYGGGTIIDGGSVIGSAGSLRGTIVNNGQITFGGDTSGLFAGNVTGSGTLLKTGTGTLAMNGAQPLTGLFTVAQGTLALNGSYGGSLNVLANASLRASGFIAGSLNLAGSLFAVAPGTTFAPPSLQAGGLSATGGDSLEGPSFLSIGQNFTATNGSVLNFAIGPGSNPTVLVGGTASLNGTRLNITAPSIGDARSTSFLALAALNGLSVQSSDVITGDAGVLPSLTLDRNALFVTLINLNPPLKRFAGPGTIGVADAIDRGKFGGTDDATFVIKELTALDDDKLRDALDQLAGELHASVMQTAILDAEAVSDMVRDQMASRDLSGNNFETWAETTCQRGDYKGNDEAHPGHATVCTGAGGVDKQFSEKWVVGGGGSYSDGNMNVDGGGKGDYQAPRAFGYVGFKPNRFGFRGGGSAAKSNTETQRQIDFQAVLPAELGGQPISEGVHRKAEAKQDGDSQDAWSEINDRRKIGEYQLEAMLGVRRARISRGSFAEDGAISIDLAAQEEIIKLTQTDVKVNVIRRVGRWRPFFDVFYRRELAESQTRAAVKFEGLPSSDFIVQGLNIPASTFSVKGGMMFAALFGKAVLTYEFKKLPGQQHQSVGFRVRF